MAGTATDRTSERQAIRDVVDRYAHHADRGEPRRQAECFTLDGTVRVFAGDPGGAPVETVSGRENLVATFTGLIARYDATTYLNGQSTIERTGPESATGETYCVAFHLLHDDSGERVLLTMSIRYLDTFANVAGEWLISDRRLLIDWTDRRPSTP